jgi:RNA polymerase sigma factor (sigma-70 family)
MGNHPSFEDSLPQIDKEINKRRVRWTTALPWLAFEDVAQMIRLHIFKKWHLYDPSRPLVSWVNRVITNVIKNILRAVYGNNSRPCIKCPAAQIDEGCELYDSQCSDCPIFAAWEKTRKRVYDVKLPVSLENHENEVHNQIDEFFDLDKAIKVVHKRMQDTLKPGEWRIYKWIYLEGIKEEQIAQMLGYKTTEEGRTAGYKQIRNMKKTIIEKVNKMIIVGDIDIT